MYLRLATVATALLGLLSAACGDPSPTDLSPEHDVRHVPRPDVVRGVYVNAQAAGSPTRLASLLELADGSNLNTFVVDVKERGEVSYASAVPLVGEVGSDRGYIADLPGLLQTLLDHGLYPIARIVCFRDPVLAEARPEWAIRTSDGGVWLDPENNRPWVDPFHPDVWQYNVELAREALEIGFAEIQWDYVRFPDVSDSVRATMVFPAQAGRSWGEGIQDFIAESRTVLATHQAPITADVFGRVITDSGHSGIGQDFDELVRVTDVLLPMVYPSLYRAGNFDIPDPQAEPYRLVRTAMDSAVTRVGRVDGAVATIRPWLQAFTLGSTVYGPAQILDQIRAVEDAGLEEWLFWHPESVYPTGVF
ncbi:MAG: putative glycoside hydrolase [Gemmatimonadota bacterium]|nr:putative glycoside hydrolase [Gemmatimonadota bacterium]MDH3425028.1 putative glycoside hydrolase [Gemmatimonadota bacterium]